MRIEFDDSRLFEAGRAVVLTRTGERVESSIEEVRFQHGRWVLKLEGVGTIADAQTWVGGQVSIRRDELPEPAEGSFFDFQLRGCVVYEDGRPLGDVVNVVDYGGTALLQIDREGREVLIPFAERYLRKVDIDSRRIDVELPEGLVDLNP